MFNLSLLKIIQELQAVKEKSGDSRDDMEKVVVVSQWTSMLQIVKKHLQKLNLKFAEINGNFYSKFSVWNFSFRFILNDLPFDRASSDQASRRHCQRFQPQGSRRSSHAPVVGSRRCRPQPRRGQPPLPPRHALEPTTGVAGTTYSFGLLRFTSIPLFECHTQVFFGI